MFTLFNVKLSKRFKYVKYEKISGKLYKYINHRASKEY